MDIRKQLITEYDWPENYIYIPWPIDELSRKALSKEQIKRVEQNIADANAIIARYKGR
ncbi:MAG: hypothetical protein Q8R55_03360 [Candidatus Taylorbacteria bacterium]|nr:hypothetical protein [Candidatus Taylorbacteria bacterium]